MSAPTTVEALREALLTLHRPYYNVGGRPFPHRVQVSRDDVPEGHVCQIDSEFDTCDPEDHYVEACVECRWSTEDGDPAFPLWPCPTARLALVDSAVTP